MSHLAEQILPISLRTAVKILFPKLRKIAVTWFWPNCGEGREHNSGAKTLCIRTGYPSRNKEIDRREKSVDHLLFPSFYFCILLLVQLQFVVLFSFISLEMKG